MPRKGEVRVSTSLTNMREAVVWLQVAWPFISSAPVTLLSREPAQSASQEQALRSLYSRLQKSTRRKRKTSKMCWNINVPRFEAVAFITAYEGALVRGIITQRIIWQHLSFARDIETALRCVGRRPLSCDERGDRLSGAINVVDRQKKRIRKAAKVATRNQAWSRSLRRRKQTLLTDTEGPPEI